MLKQKSLDHPHLLLRMGFLALIAAFVCCAAGATQASAYFWSNEIGLNNDTGATLVLDEQATTTTGWWGALYAPPTKLEPGKTLITSTSEFVSFPHITPHITKLVYKQSPSPRCRCHGGPLVITMIAQQGISIDYGNSALRGQLVRRDFTTITSTANVKITKLNSFS